MFDKHAIMTFKTKNKPIWTTPFMNKGMAVATWHIPGCPYPEYEIVNLTSPVTGGWTYEPKGE